MFLPPARKVGPGGFQKPGNFESWKAFKKRRTNYQKTCHLKPLSSSAVKLPKLKFLCQGFMSQVSKQWGGTSGTLLQAK